ncbi:hypothetical protein WMY93_003210 [Mugilogobius chulae]|uniref:Immunoglobulin C1-set domain-containing protein n=1 Tax=Mugilogobius chulae TaxID=88201 RepID=A0AAW0Q6X0_9GOBI
MTTQATEALLITNMTLVCVLMWTVLCCCFTESRGEVRVSQAGAVMAALGDTVNIQCTTSVNVYYHSTYGHRLFCGASGAQAVGAAPLQRGAGPGEGHLHVSGPQGFPSDWSVWLKVSGGGVVGGEQSRSPAVLQKDGHYSWSSSLTLPAQQWREGGVFVTCEASQGSQSPVSRTLSTLQCSQD